MGQIPEVTGRILKVVGRILWGASRLSGGADRISEVFDTQQLPKGNLQNAWDTATFNIHPPE